MIGFRGCVTEEWHRLRRMTWLAGASTAEPRVILHNRKYHVRGHAFKTRRMPLRPYGQLFRDGETNVPVWERKMTTFPRQVSLVKKLVVPVLQRHVNEETLPWKRPTRKIVSFLMRAHRQQCSRIQISLSVSRFSCWSPGDNVHVGLDLDYGETHRFQVVYISPKFQTIHSKLCVIPMHIHSVHGTHTCSLRTYI